MFRKIVIERARDHAYEVAQAAGGIYVTVPTESVTIRPVCDGWVVSYDG